MHRFNAIDPLSIATLEARSPWCSLGALNPPLKIQRPSCLLVCMPSIEPLCQSWVRDFASRWPCSSRARHAVRLVCWPRRLRFLRRWPALGLRQRLKKVNGACGCASRQRAPRPAVRRSSTVAPRAAAKLTVRTVLASMVLRLWSVIGSRLRFTNDKALTTPACGRVREGFCFSLAAKVTWLRLQSVKFQHAIRQRKYPAICDDEFVAINPCKGDIQSCGSFFNVLPPAFKVAMVVNRIKDGTIR